MAVKADFVPLVKSTLTRPLSEYEKGQKPVFFSLGSGVLGLFRDQLTISTWLAIGAILQTLLFAIGGKLAFVPAAALIIYRMADAFLIATGVKRNVYLDGVILNKFSAQYPDAQGNFGSAPANDKICVFLIGARANHPLGMFAHGFKELNDYFMAMIDDMQDNAEEYGYLGGSSWLSTAKTTSNEVMTVMYFRNHEGLHKFAHDDMHRLGWDWWNKNIANMPHIGIWHEVYVAPKGNWESIYMNSEPLLASATSFPTRPNGKGTDPTYVSPIVDARRGLLKTSAGRMSRSQGTEHDEYGDDPYDNYGGESVA